MDLTDPDLGEKQAACVKDVVANEEGSGGQETEMLGKDTGMDTSPRRPGAWASPKNPASLPCKSARVFALVAFQFPGKAGAVFCPWLPSKVTV